MAPVLLLDRDVKTSHALAAVLLTCSASSLTSVVFAQRLVDPEPPSEDVQALQESVGTITEINAEQGEVLLDGEEGALRLRVKPTTTIFVEGRTGSLADLTEGQAVRATFESGGGEATLEAEWLELTEPTDTRSASQRP